MNYQALVGKITEYMHLCTSGLSKWLEKRLPDVLGDGWWRMGVIGKLSYHQQEIVNMNNTKSLAELDLSALLRVTDKNWYTFQCRYFLKQSERMTVQKMFGVRNNWAHVPSVSPALDTIISDLKTLEDFLNFVEADRESLWEFGRLLDNVKSNGIVSFTPIELPTELIAKSEIILATTEITTNAVVHLVSDRNSVGIVLSVDKVGSISRYKVFIGGKTREFFQGQIELEQSVNDSDFIDISEIQRILTAYQIKKPSSDSLYSLNAARVDFVPYQFRPALKLIKSDTPRLLIADSVGVGKTIEAGLILKEM